jgi:hypothetical protein
MTDEIGLLDSLPGATEGLNAGAVIFTIQF